MFSSQGKENDNWARGVLQEHEKTIIKSIGARVHHLLSPTCFCNALNNFNIMNILKVGGEVPWLLLPQGWWIYSNKCSSEIFDNYFKLYERNRILTWWNAL